MIQPEIIRIGHVGLRTTDAAAMRDHYVDVLGLDVCREDPDGTLHLTCGGAGADVELIPAEISALDHVAFDLAPGAGMDQVADQLGSMGILCERSAKEDPGAEASVVIRDPEGNRIQLMIPDGRLESVPSPRGIRARKLGHVAIRVTNTPAISEWYQEHLGFRWSDSNDVGITFLRCNADHHALNFVQTPNPGRDHHIAFELEDDFTAIQRAGDALANAEVPIVWGPGRHSAGHSIFCYYYDPDRHIIELFNQMDRMSHPAQGYFDPRPWHHDRPQQPKLWPPGARRSSGMSPQRPPGFFE